MVGFSTASSELANEVGSYLILMRRPGVGNWLDVIVFPSRTAMKHLEPFQEAFE